MIFLVQLDKPDAVEAMIRELRLLSNIPSARDEVLTGMRGNSEAEDQDGEYLVVVASRKEWKNAANAIIRKVAQDERPGPPNQLNAGKDPRRFSSFLCACAEPGLTPDT